MAGGGNFTHRVISYLVNELVVNKLANSPAFQRFAVRTSKRIEDAAVRGSEMKEEVTELFKDLTREMQSSKKH